MLKSGLSQHGFASEQRGHDHDDDQGDGDGDERALTPAMRDHRQCTPSRASPCCVFLNSQRDKMNFDIA
eukprot:9101398-Pyramimonas_sp.AAC.1